MSSLILRFRSKEGMHRINTTQSSNFQSIVNDLLPKLSNQNLEEIILSNNPNSNNESNSIKLSSILDKTVSELNLKNGDLLYITYLNNNEPTHSKQLDSIPINSTTTSTTNISTSHGPLTQIKQLPVDDELDKLDGMIQRPISSMCRHGPKGMCEYCSPLSPWDENYRKENSIKHISYHSYLNQQMTKFNKKELNSSYIAPLENPNYKIDLNCNEGHKPYPKGICSKCQPSPITLQLQKFRMVDHLEYSSHTILNEFINTWRNSGYQRFGYLYGRYEKFDKVPMGIKAVVEAIIEPPQNDEIDGLTLLNNSNWENDEKLIDSIASQLGIYKVGIVFTDLTDSGMGNGTVLCKRHKDSYFLTNLEIIMSGKFQISNPNKTKYSSNGEFSSKFITCVISGGINGEIEPRSYQVSNNGESLIKADLITGSTQPSQIFVNNSNDTRYVPDISFSKINEYGLEIKTNAKPTFPGEFLLVSLTDSFPLEPNPMFNSKSYIIENREFLGDINKDFQNLSTLYKYLKNQASDIFDFHFLIYIIKLRILNDDEARLLIDYIKTRDISKYNELINTGGWLSLITILEQSS
ncbi:NPL4 [Candida pseudojiufengensis]|uniref:NPL4 n=1 Tax=Candida pseudojiufengensis TaxID=497109 RepID=UPI0022246FB3|nr:NPL4 [Candida pseudojiufengensis]KAI5966373.1 NPL4 [Candida pseudojiufengensis]